MPARIPTNINARRLVGVHAEHVSNVSSKDYPGHYPGEDNSWNLQDFKENLKLDITRISQRSIALDLVGVDASIANALRRTLIADVPTICIEHVYVFNNTSVVVDEVFSHRLGLVPLNVDPDLFELAPQAGEPPTDRNTLVFKLKVACTRKPNPPPGSSNPDELYENHEVTSGMLQWEPQGEQSEVPELLKRPPAATNPNIVLAKLRPGQVVDMECHAVKGFGRDHAKWMPVATASYRIHPYIKLIKQPPPYLARKFANCFSPGVVKVLDEGTPQSHVGVDTSQMRGESMSREVFRHSEFEGCVELGRIRDWFLFNIESEGPYTPEDLVPAAIRSLRSRISVLRHAAQALASGEDDTSSNAHMNSEIRTDGDVAMMDS